MQQKPPLRHSQVHPTARTKRFLQRIFKNWILRVNPEVLSSNHFERPSFIPPAFDFGKPDNRVVARLPLFAK